MEITALAGMDLVSLEWSSSRFEFRVVAASGKVWEASLTNPGQAPVRVAVESLNLRLIYDPNLSVYTLGELETVSVRGTEVTLEADAGTFSVDAARIFIQKLAGVGHGNAA